MHLQLAEKPQGWHKQSALAFLGPQKKAQLRKAFFFLWCYLKLQHTATIWCIQQLHNNILLSCQPDTILEFILTYNIYNLWMVHCIIICSIFNNNIKYFKAFLEKKIIKGQSNLPTRWVLGQCETLSQNQDVWLLRNNIQSFLLASTHMHTGTCVPPHTQTLMKINYQSDSSRSRTPCLCHAGRQFWQVCVWDRKPIP